MTMPSLDKDLILAQAKLSKSLSLGFVLTLVPFPLFGVAALFIGLRANKAIATSQEKLTGRGMAYWCVGIGLLETIVWLGSICLI